MATTHGKNGKVKLSTSNLVGELTRWRVTKTVATSDSTAQGDSWQTHNTGIPAWSAEIEGWYDPTDSNGQATITVGASLDCDFYHDGDSSGKTYESGTATVTDVTIESAMDGTNKFSATLQGNGALTEETV